MITSLLICGLIITFFVVVLTGPYFVEKRNHKKELDNRPLAKVIPFPYKGNHPNKV